MSEFYPPYQFIPVTGKINGKENKQDYKDLKKGKAKNNPQSRHDVYHKQGRSGKIVCSLYLNSPTVVGNKHEDDAETGKKRIKQYQWNHQPAIPANSIKGMITSLAEALSQSTLRILNADKDPDKPNENKKMRVKDPDADSQYGTKKVSIPKNTHEYFGHIDPDLKPWQEGRDNLTPAEVLFGTVEVNEKDENSETGRSLGGRVRFSNARTLEKATQLKEVTLKLLSEPRTPCPAMYYHVNKQKGKYLSKENIYNHPESTQIYPNGRKFYLHHPLFQRSSSFWESPTQTERDQHKFLCRPLQQDQTFYFHLDFFNLSDKELTLLNTAISPSSNFQNKIGLGKPLGLGSVTVKTEGIFYKDYTSRYGVDSALKANKYQSAWINTDNGNENPPKELLGIYPHEFDNDYDKEEKPDNTGLIDTKTLNIINTIGDPSRMHNDMPVRTPILPDQEDTPEKETFRWFNSNDQEGNQALPEVVPNVKIPFLYADMQDARDSSEFNEAELSILEEEEKAGLPEDTPELIIEFIKHSVNENFQEVLISKPLAEHIVNDKVDGQLQNEILDWLETYWINNNLPTNTAQKIYEQIRLLNLSSEDSEEETTDYLRRLFNN